MRIGTLFSGIGAPEQGAKRVYDDLEMVFACEFDKFARESFNANYEIHEDHFHIDVNDMDGTQYKDKVDIIIGGSPCQAFSIAGLREGLNDKRGQLIWQYYRIIMEAQPEIFIYENVKGMVSDNNGNTLKDFLDVFRESGYFCHHAVLNTKDYGVPQNRERVYIVGFKDHELYHRFQFAPKIKLEKRLKDFLDFKSERGYLSEEKIKSFKGGKSVFSERFKIMDLDINYVANCLDTRNPRDRRTQTFFNINGKVGYCTSLECWKLQDFPIESYTKAKDAGLSNNQLYKQAGNSMSVNILEMIFRQIEKAKQNEPTNTLMDFLNE